MNDTTRWIMIILLLLLIAAAVFMLLRSPGKDNGKDEGDTATLTDRRDADRDGVADTRQDRVEESRTADRGVYDQEADTRAVPVVDTPTTSADQTRTVPVAQPPAADEDTRADTTEEAAPTVAEAEPARWEAEQEAAREPVESATYEDTATAPTEGRYDDTMAPPFQEAAPTQQRAEDEDLGGAAPVGSGATAASATAASADGTTTTTPAQDMTDVHPLTDDQVDEGGREEPLTRQEQADLTDDRERPVGEESTTYRAAGGEAVVVGQDRGTDGGNWTETHAGPDTRDPDTGPDATAGASTAGTGTTYADTGEDPVGTGTFYADTEATPAGWDAPPADAGTGAPRTADEIATGGDGTAPGAGATDTTGTAFDTGTEQGGFAPVFTEAAYGPGSAEPLEDGTGPAGWEIKGNVGSMLFHTPESPSYDAIRAEVWFESEEAARAAGFAHWDRRRR